MGQTGKRSRFQKDNSGNSKSQRQKTERTGNNGDELIVYRILCPDGVIGSVIGKGGKVINSIRQETRARVKVLDPFPGAKERVLTVYCYVKEKEEVELGDEYNNRDLLCPAQDALLRLHAAIAYSVAALSESDKRMKDKEECNILVPASQAANIIGKSGATIKKLRHKFRANIKVTAKDMSDPTHSCALEFDNFVQITGEPEAVKGALFAVSSIMYKFAPKEEVPLDFTVAEAPPSIIIPSDVSLYPATGLYGATDPVIFSRPLPTVVGGSVPELSGYPDSGSAWPIYSSPLPVSSYSGASQSKELIIRLLCPSDKIGRVIGKAGASIKSVRHASGTKIEVVDNKDRGDDSLITITATESVDDLKSMAVEAVLLLQEKINDEGAELAVIKLLVPSKVIGCIIGKAGSIINEIRKKSKADVQIPKGKRPRCADSNDELVEVSGEALSVRDALVQIVLRLRDDILRIRDDGNKPSAASHSTRSASSGGGVGGGLSAPLTLPSASSVASFGYEPRDQGVEAGTRWSRLYGYEPFSIGDRSHGSMPSYSAKHYGGVAPPTTLEIVVPVNALAKVMGKSGSNLANIRQISGAVIEISDSITSHGDRVALISGTPEQKRSAENLIQAFIMAT